MHNLFVDVKSERNLSAKRPREFLLISSNAFPNCSNFPELREINLKALPGRVNAAHLESTGELCNRRNGRTHTNSRD